MPPEPPTHTLRPTAESARKLVLAATPTICQVFPSSFEIWTAPVGERVHCCAGTTPPTMLSTAGAAFEAARVVSACFRAATVLTEASPFKAAGEGSTAACAETSTVSAAAPGTSVSLREGD